MSRSGGKSEVICVDVGSAVAVKAGDDAPGGGISLCFCRRGCAAPAQKAATLNALPLRLLQAKPFSVAAKKIRIGYGPRCRYGHCRRAIPHCSSEDAASIPKFGPEIKNRCTQEDINRQNLASIPKSEPEIKNRCTQEGINRQNLASIRKSGLEIKNRCTQEGINRQKPCIDSQV